jgi:signal peptidase II
MLASHMTKFSKVIVLACFLILSMGSALALREYLQVAQLDGTKLFSVLIASLNLEYTVNTGINFGLASEATSFRQYLLALLACFVCLGALFWGVLSQTILAPLIAGLLAGGGLANAYERIAFGGVFDYLNVSLAFFSNPFSFNLADIYIFMGVLLFIFRPQRSGD